MSFQFTEKQSKTLALICETINPVLPPTLPDDHPAVFENHAGDYPIVEEFRKRLAKNPAKSKKRSLATYGSLICQSSAGWRLSG